MVKKTTTLDKFKELNELAHRRGFFWPAYEIYGGASGFVTYGFIGSRIKQKLERKIRARFVKKLGLLEIDSPIISPRIVFEASGHLENFTEPMVECKKCKKKFRADHLLSEIEKTNKETIEKLSLPELEQQLLKQEIRCPDCNAKLSKTKEVLTMFETKIGPYSNDIAYGRPEAAQGIFVEFKRIYETARERMPLGVMQIGRALRNEISPRQSLLRLREFTIIDIEFFFDPEDPECNSLEEVENETLRLLLTREKKKNSKKIVEVTVKEALRKKFIKESWQAFFMVHAKKLLIELGVPAKKQRFNEKFPWAQAHYARQSFDQEVYVQRWGWVEVSGHVYRTDYDLKRHMKTSGIDLQVFKKLKQPVYVTRSVVKPLLAKLGPVFKTRTASIINMLSKTDPKKLKTEFEKKGFYLLGNVKIFPEHVKMEKEDIRISGKKFTPHVIEPSFGLDRLFYVILDNALQIKENRTIMRLPRDIVPIEIGVFPVVTKDGLPKRAKQIFRMLVNEGWMVEYDETGSIGRRYARSDEIGIPLGITIDYETLTDETVTVRDRDSWIQIRVKLDDLPKKLHHYFSWKKNFEDF